MILALLEVASRKLTILELFNHSAAVERIEKAIERHPDLKNLLEPVKQEIRIRNELLITARAAISTARAMAKKLEL